MPHLQFEFNKKLSDNQKQIFAEKIRQLFSAIMDTGTDHISISIREYDTFNLSVGRVKDLSQGVCLVNADIREGRTIEKRRALALGFMDNIMDITQIPKENMYVTFTQHTGEDFHLDERYLASWQEGEDPLKD